VTKHNSERVKELVGLVPGLGETARDEKTNDWTSSWPSAGARPCRLKVLEI